jgi:hypothetical protein
MASQAQGEPVEVQISDGTPAGDHGFEAISRAAAQARSQELGTKQICGRMNAAPGGRRRFVLAHWVVGNEVS